jgi:hypothetical protein
LYRNGASRHRENLANTHDNQDCKRLKEEFIAGLGSQQKKHHETVEKETRIMKENRDVFGVCKPNRQIRTKQSR